MNSLFVPDNVPSWKGLEGTHLGSNILWEIVLIGDFSLIWWGLIYKLYQSHMTTNKQMRSVGVAELGVS